MQARSIRPDVPTLKRKSVWFRSLYIDRPFAYDSPVSIDAIKSNRKSGKRDVAVQKIL